MAPDSIEFRECYLHPSRPAIRDCINCERPICALCEEESGDVLLCLPCKEELEKLETPGVAVPFKKDDLRVAGSRATPIDIGEVTIMQDGSVVEAPEPIKKKPEEKPPAGTKRKPIAHAKAEIKPQPSKEKEAGDTEEPARKVKRPLPPEMRTLRKPSPVPPPRRRPSAEAPEREQARAQEAPDGEESAAVPEGEPETVKRPARSRPAERAVKTRQPRPKRESKLHEGPLAQLLSGLPFGLAAALAVSGVWLLFAFIAKQWSQIAIFTLGIAVPWAIYKGTTVRKHAGIPIWKEPSQPLWVGIASLALVAALTVPLQLLAFQVIYGSNPARLPFSDYMDRFFKGVDWLLLIFGLLLAFIVPFVLKEGAGWRKPARKRVQAAEDDDDDARMGDEESTENSSTET